MKKRKTIAAIIIALGFAGAFLINLTSGNQQKTGEQTIINPENKNSLDYTKTAAKDQQNTDPNTDQSGYNVTDYVSHAYLREFLGKNENLFGHPEAVAQGVNLNIADPTLPENVTDTVFNFEPFKTKDIKISQETGSAAEIAYLEAINAIGQKNFSSFTGNLTDILGAWLDKKDSGPLQKYLSSIDNEIKDLQQLAVPTNWQEFHLRNLNLWQKKKTVYQAILESDNDPLKSYLAAQEIDNIIGENANLQKTATAKYNELTKK